MALSTAKISEFSFNNPISLSLSHLRRRFSLLTRSSSLRTSQSTDPNSRKYPWDEDDDGNAAQSPPPPPRRSAKTPSAPWLQHWSPPPPQKSTTASAGPGGSTSIERIVHRLRNLGVALEEEEEGKNSNFSLSGNESLGELLERSWNRPGSDTSAADKSLLPWERNNDVGGDDDELGFVTDDEDQGKVRKRRRVKAPTLAELTIEDEELRRLRRAGMVLRERITVPKAGVTQAITQKIHDAWRKSEVVRIKFHEDLAHDMRTAHELVERRTGGLVIWRSGSVMVVYRGGDYKRPSKSQSCAGESSPMDTVHNDNFVPDVSASTKSAIEGDAHTAPAIEGDTHTALAITKTKLSQSGMDENMTEEEAEFNHLLDELGPRFVDWWGTGILPVDADMLPQKIPGYKTPFRLLPTGMRSCLTNSEMTNLRKLARSLPCHFALGRNRNHQGLATAILKLWEKSLVVKIAVKRGIQNTNNKLMAEELKNLTGGTLLLRNKYYIVIYRGKDFLPPSVATVLAEREELTKDIQAVEENARNVAVGDSSTQNVEGYAPAGTLAEFLEVQARWGRNVSAEELEELKEAASKSKATKLFKRVEHKLSIAQAKKLRAERLLAKIETSMVPVLPSNDQETITDEERSVYRRIGLKMKSYLPLGIRGVFDGVIENMHLHWKHRELVKLISKQKTLSFVEDTARLIEYESGGILVSIERVPKGFAIIYYRGKNYQRPINLRPRNLLTKAKALKRAVAIQRHEALSQHIMELERTIGQMKSDLGISDTEGKVEECTLDVQSQIEELDSSVESEEEEDEEEYYDDDSDDDGFDDTHSYGSDEASEH